MLLLLLLLLSFSVFFFFFFYFFPLFLFVLSFALTYLRAVDWTLNSKKQLPLLLSTYSAQTKFLEFVTSTLSLFLWSITVCSLLERKHICRNFARCHGFQIK